MIRYTGVACGALVLLLVGWGVLIGGSGAGGEAEAQVVNAEEGLRGEAIDSPRHTRSERKQRESVQRVRALEVAAQRGDDSARQALRAVRRYDRAGFEKNPDAYLEVADPQRLDDILPDEKAEVRLRALSDEAFEITPGQEVRLRVETAPGAPVTFVAFDGGSFVNGLATITVRANARGRASARFAVSDLVYGAGHVMAASPEAAGRVTFIFEVPVPEGDQ